MHGQQQSDRFAFDPADDPREWSPRNGAASRQAVAQVERDLIEIVTTVLASNGALLEEVGSLRGQVKFLTGRVRQIELEREVR